MDRFPTAEERWPRQGEVASITKPYEFPKLVIEAVSYTHLRAHET